MRTEKEEKAAASDDPGHKVRERRRKTTMGNGTVPPPPWRNYCIAIWDWDSHYSALHSVQCAVSCSVVLCEKHILSPSPPGCTLWNARNYFLMKMFGQGDLLPELITVVAGQRRRRSCSVPSRLESLGYSASNGGLTDNSSNHSSIRVHCNCQFICYCEME